MMTSVRRNSCRYSVVAALVMLLAPPVPHSSLAATAGEVAGQALAAVPGNPLRTKAVKQGMAIELAVEPLSPGSERQQVREGEYANLRISITDMQTGSPVTTMFPSVWVDQRKEFQGDKNRQTLTCSEKIRSYLQGGLSYRPDIDLNSYYILAMNNDATISVIDPIMGVAGYSQMYKMILLRAAGADWTHGPGEKTLYVTMPKAGQVAVIDLEQFTVIRNLPAGDQPSRLVLQPDGRFFWVANDAPGAAGGVTVLDGKTGAVVKHIPTAAGRHDITVADDSLTVFVSNRDAGTVSIIDTQSLQRLKDLKTGANPAGLVYSAMGKAAYVIDEKDGTITIVDGRRREISRVIREEAGLSDIAFTTDGRWGIILNGVTNTALVIDPAANEVVYREPVGAAPEQVSFSPAFAYIRSRGTAEVTLLALDSIGKGDRVTSLKVSGGSKAPTESTYYRSPADSITVTPENNAVVIASPADATIIYYMEGMGVPMGSFKNAGRTPRALKTVNRSLRETGPGVYSAKIKIPRDGLYDVMFLLDSPRVTECFTFAAEANPVLGTLKAERPVTLQFLMPQRTGHKGVPSLVRFQVLDEASGEPVARLVDLEALSTLTPYGAWQQRYPVTAVGNGVYEFSFTPPEAGSYNIYFAAASLKLRFSQLPYISLQVSP